jgi:protein ImuB
MLDELAVELRERQAQIQRLRIAFEHLHRPPTFETFDLLEPAHECAGLLHLIRDRLERSVLPAPAVALRLSSGFLQPLKLREADLFEKIPVEGLARRLLERLQERLGPAAVYGMDLRAEHRPECAWSKLSEPLVSGARRNQPLPSRAVRRPLWLLPGPVPLSSSASRDYYQGSLALCSGPERIESGWWDGGDVSRDYYLAISSQGQKLWIFRDRRSRDWHLHGLFG